MTSFALITEGITDQAVITAILQANYDDEPDINEVQPVRDETDNHRQGNMAGWEKVLEYCGLARFEEDFLTNEYVIIQIDTDVSEHPNFGASLIKNGIEVTTKELIEDVKRILMLKIGERVYKNYQNRIIFAISVHSIECWLLPIFANEKNTKNKTKNCEKHLIRALSKKNLDYKKEFPHYEIISKNFFKKKNFDIAKNNNESLKIFIDSLPK